MFDFLVGDKLMKQGYDDIYQEVVGRPRKTSHVRTVCGYSRVCPEGETGDTSIDNVACLVSPEAWEFIRDLGWPPITSLDSNLFELVLFERNGRVFPCLQLVEPPDAECH